MPKLVSNPKNPETWASRDVPYSVRLHPHDRVALEHHYEALDCPRTSVLRALVRLGLAVAETEPERLVQHLRIPTSGVRS